MDTTTVTSVRKGRRRTHRIFVETAVDGSIEGLTRHVCAADTSRMIWPVAALAVFLLGFVVVYGSVLQARLETGARRPPEDSGVETEIA
jgi:hypothetical protein